MDKPVGPTPATISLVGVFATPEQVETAVRRIADGQLADEWVPLHRRQDGPEAGTNPENQQSAAAVNDGTTRPQHASAVIGAALGGAAGLLAATYVIPGLGALTSAAPSVSALLGTGLGALTGVFLEGTATAPDTAPDQPLAVNLGAVLLLCRTDASRQDRCRAALVAAGAQEVRTVSLAGSSPPATC